MKYLVCILVVFWTFTETYSQSVKEQYQVLQELLKANTEFQLAYYDDPWVMMVTMEEEPSHKPDSIIYRRRCGTVKSCFILFDRLQYYVMKFDYFGEDQMQPGRLGILFNAPPDTLIIINNAFVREFNGRLGRLLNQFEVPLKKSLPIERKKMIRDELIARFKKLANEFR